MEWACMAANGTRSLIFIDDMRADRSSRMNSEVYKALLSTQIQPLTAILIEQCITVQMDNDAKHTVKAKRKEMEYSSMAKSVT